MTHTDPGNGTYTTCQKTSVLARLGSTPLSVWCFSQALHREHPPLGAPWASARGETSEVPWAPSSTLSPQEELEGTPRADGSTIPAILVKPAPS